VSKPEEAEAIFRGAFNCAQAVFAAFAPELGLERELALRVAGGLAVESAAWAMCAAP